MRWSFAKAANKVGHPSRLLGAVMIAAILGLGSTPQPAGATSTATTGGYWLAGADGGVFSFGSASFYGSEAGHLAKNNVVGIANTLAPVTGGVPGYDLVTSAGEVYTCDQGCGQSGTGYYGSLSAAPPSPVVGMASDVHGYILAAANGAVYPFGADRSYGSAAATHLNAPIVGIADYLLGDNAGYWLVAADGGVFSFGSARFYGSMGGKVLNAPVVGMASTPGGHGYWLVAADGGVFSFGSARFYGSMGGKPLNQPIVGMAPTPNGGGYWLVAADGGVFSFGNASFYGSMGGKPLNARVVGMATPCQTPSGIGCY